MKILPARFLYGTVIITKTTHYSSQPLPNPSNDPAQNYYSRATVNPDADGGGRRRGGGRGPLVSRNQPRRAAMVPADVLRWGRGAIPAVEGGPQPGG